MKDMEPHDCVEAEIVDGPGAPRREAPEGQTSRIIFKAKLFLAAAGVAAGLALIALGALLTATLIGALLGVPMILAGAGVIWLALRVLFFGKANFVVFRGGPR